MIKEVTKTDIMCPKCKKGVLVMTPFRDEQGIQLEGKIVKDNVAIDCSTSPDVGGTGNCDYIQSWYCKLTQKFIDNRRQELK